MTDIYHPAPVNQFYALDYDEVQKKWFKDHRWNHVHLNQNGVMTSWDGLLCMAAGGAVMLDAHTSGGKHASPGQIHDHQSDNLGGIGVDDVQDSWANNWNETLWVPRDFNWDDTVYAIRAQRRACLIAVDYDMVPYDYQVQKGGTFDHAIVLEDWRATDSRLRRYDSLDTAPLWAPQSAYRAAAEKIAIRQRGTRSSLFVGFTRSRPLLSDLPRFIVSIRSYTNLYSGPNGTRVAAVSSATYICQRKKFTNSKGVAEWWYRILTKANGAATANANKWFKPHVGVTAKWYG